MKKRTITISIIAAVLVCILAGILALCFAVNSWIQDNQIIGLNSAEIQEKYGEFDYTDMEADADGLYRKTYCSYIIIDARRSFLGTKTPFTFIIGFDQNGIADEYYFDGGDTYLS